MKNTQIIIKYFINYQFLAGENNIIGYIRQTIRKTGIYHSERIMKTTGIPVQKYITKTIPGNKTTTEILSGNHSKCSGTF